jgi:predicted 2-oxoglutarate/Fe(II)-dependent dioxygenase YbiX
VNLFIVNDALDVETCRSIQSAMDVGVAEPASVLGDSVDVEVETRRATDIEVEDDVIAMVESRLDAYRDAIAAFYGLPLQDREGCGFLRYDAGGFYGPHVDRADLPSWPGASRRQITVVLFLNSSDDAAPADAFGGGVLRVFPRGLDDEAVDIAPRRGLMVAFPAALPHEVTVVTHGRRDAVVDWFY